MIQWQFYDHPRLPDVCEGYHVWSDRTEEANTAETLALTERLQNTQMLSCVLCLELCSCRALRVHAEPVNHQNLLQCSYRASDLDPCSNEKRRPCLLNPDCFYITWTVEWVCGESSVTLFCWKTLGSGIHVDATLTHTVPPTWTLLQTMFTPSW